MRDTRLTLLTNLIFISIGDVRTYCSALLLEDTESELDRDKRRLRIRGFGPYSTWPVFDLLVSSIDYVLTPVEHSPARHVMTVGGRELELVADNQEPLAIDRFEGGVDAYLRCWAVLPLRARQFWRGKNMPEVVWRPVR